MTSAQGGVGFAASAPKTWRLDDHILANAALASLHSLRGPLFMLFGKPTDPLVDGM